MKHPDRCSATFFLLLGLAVFVHGFRLRLKVGSDMGPGLLPFIVGGILSLLSCILLFQAFTRKVAPELKKPFWANPLGWKAVLVTLLAAAIYPFALKGLGFLLSTYLFLFFLFTIIGHQTWWKACLGGVSTALIGYLIFEVWLKANMPRGILGF